MGGVGKGTLTGSIVALVQAAVGLALAFDLPITRAQSDAIQNVVVAFAAVLPLVGAIFDHGAAQARARVAAAVVASPSPVDLATIAKVG